MHKRGVTGILNLFGAVKTPYNELALFKVKDVMSRNVATVSKDKPLTDAAYMMIGAHISSLVALSGSKPIGILTERDFIKKIDMSKPSKKELLVSDIMSEKIVSVSPDMDLFSAQKLMRQNNFRKLVVEQKGGVVGIITQTDLCKAAAGLKNHSHDTPKVADIMTKKVVTASPDDTFQKVKKIMSQKDMGSIIIEDNGAIKGIFTEADVVSEYYLNPNRLRNSYMQNLMNTPVVCITPEFDAFLANKIMMQHNFRRLPIIENGNMVGIITQTDVARAIYSHLEANKDKPNSQAWNHKDVQITSEKKDSTMVLGLRKN